MSSKLLSVIVPTYNMEALLPRCLESLCSQKGLEVLVVNDGSKDSSLEVANRFEEQHPDTFRVIDKPNGNYGSTINAALPLAQGRFVKILDADDWFSPDALAQTLASLEGLECDMVVTHYSVIRESGRTELAKYNLYGREPYEYGRVYDLDEVLGGGHIRFFLMHSLMWRTSLLTSHGYLQTEGISYTDLEWDTFPMFWAKSIAFLDIDLYQYNMAREGQTMDPKVLLRSSAQLERVTDSLLDFYAKQDVGALSETRQRWIRAYYLNRLRLVCKMHLLDMPRDAFDPEHFAQIDERYQAACERFGLGTIRLYPENKIIRADALAHYHKWGRRWSPAFERFNHCLDGVMRFLYVKFFRKG